MDYTMGEGSVVFTSGLQCLVALLYLIQKRKLMLFVAVGSVTINPTGALVVYRESNTIFTQISGKISSSYVRP